MISLLMSWGYSYEISKEIVINLIIGIVCLIGYIGCIFHKK